MKKILFYVSILFCFFSCGTNVPIYYNVCNKSDCFEYRENIDFVRVKKTDSLFQNFCQYLSDTKNFTHYKGPKKTRPNSTYIFEFYASNKRIKSIYIHRWNDPEFYSMEDYGWSTTYIANIESTKKLLKSLGCIPESL